MVICVVCNKKKQVRKSVSIGDINSENPKAQIELLRTWMTNLSTGKLISVHDF